MATIPKGKETITLFNNKLATVYKISREEAVSHGIDYDILQDTKVEGDNTRTITLKKRPTTDRQKKLNEVTETILEKLGEKESKLLRRLLKDATADYFDEIVEELYSEVILKKKPVKSREGCFKIIIGDGRKKNHHEIQLLG